MKNLLFSRSHKKHYTDAVVRMGKNNLGFSLVELIIVIAIMAVLAAIAIPTLGVFIEKSKIANDKQIVNDVLYAMTLGAETGFDAKGETDSSLSSQYNTGVAMPLGFIVISDEVLTTTNAAGATVSGTMIALSNDTVNDPIGDALANALGANYGTAMALKYDGWSVGMIGTSALHNASAGMVQKIENVGSLMITVGDLGYSMTSEDYDNVGDMIITVGQRIADYDDDGEITDNDKKSFIAAWADADDVIPDQAGFGLRGRENYSAVRLAYSSAFAEYVRANYDGEQDANALADAIANYGKPAGDVAYDEAYEIAYNKAPVFKDTAGKAAGGVAKAAAEAAAPGATFPWAATQKAFNDAQYPGYNDAVCQALYNEWINGQDEKDAAMFYDTMLSAAVDGQSYVNNGHTQDEFIGWFTQQAQTYSKNFNKIEELVQDKNAIVVVVYYKNAELSCEVYSTEADPRND